MKKVFTFAFFACALAACSKTPSANAPPAHPGVLRVAVYAEPHSLNPILASNTAENFFASLAFDELVTLDANGNEVADLAERVPTSANGDIAKDGLSIRYKLRHGVTWHDGAPFSSADVAFSWQAVMNPKNNVVERRGYDQVASVDTPDPYTVVFHLKRPFAPFVDTVFSESDDPFRILPKHLLARYADINRVPFDQLPVGTGPFRVTRWAHGDRVEYAANTAYFRGRPGLSKVIALVVPDFNTATAELRSHQVDLIVTLPAPNYKILQSDPSVRLMVVKAPSYTSIEMNLQHPPLNDVRVRRAIDYAIDKQRIVSDLTAGTGTLATADLSPFYWAYAANVPTYPHDLAKAGALLDSAGWKRGAGGVRYKDGKPLAFQLAMGIGSETARAIGVKVQADLHAAGIDVNIKPYSYAVLYATQALGGILHGGKFDLAEFSWVAGADPDDSSQWMCSMAPPAGNNDVRYCNAEVDKAENDALTHFDRARRKAAYAIVQRHIATDVPMAFLYYSPLRYAMDPNLRNFQPNGISEGWNAYEWKM